MSQVVDVWRDPRSSPFAMILYLRAEFRATELIRDENLGVRRTESVFISSLPTEDVLEKLDALDKKHLMGEGPARIICCSNGWEYRYWVIPAEDVEETRAAVVGDNGLSTIGAKSVWDL